MDQLIFLPLLLQVLLVQFMFVRLAMVKARASAAGEVDEARRALHADAWPDYVQQVNNNIRNQFEAPVLFYVLVVVAYLLNAVSVLTHILAWAFVVSRIAHAWVHTHSNYVPLRRRIFIFGTVLLLVMSVLCVIELIGLIL